MKYLALASLLLLCSCKKNNIGENGGNRLQYIKSEGKMAQRFTYNEDGLLVKEDWFSGCDQTPMDEFSYTYTGTRLDSVKSVMRSLYSSTSMLCDPAAGLRSYAVAAYDAEGRLSRITRENGTLNLFYYNAQGLIEKKVVSDGGTATAVYTYKRDVRGNIVEETDPQGHVMQYEFDDKINPYYRMKKHPDVVTAFNDSPNNVVQIISGNNTSIIRYEYNRSGLPVKMIDNGAVYELIYR